MSDIRITDLRRLRKEAKELNATLVQDLHEFPFWDQNPPVFRRLPTSTPDPDPNPTTSCSCLMALALAGRLEEFFGKDKYVKRTKGIFTKIVDSAWKSSGLEPMNAFTTAIVLRTAGFLQGAGILTEDEYKELRHTLRNKRGKETEKELRLPEIAKSFAAKLPDKFRIWRDSREPPSMTVAYWWLDAMQRGGVGLGSEQSPWKEPCKWATRQFRKQRSLVVSEHEAFMDPIEMAMTASLCAKLRHLANESLCGLTPDLSEFLSTRLELEDSLVFLMQRQTDAGIWPKYFPLFNYPEEKKKGKGKGGGGSNYCFTFEMLEAVLDSFGADDVEFCEIETVFNGLQKAVNWCRRNKLTYHHKGKPYSGWNSGGQVQTLAMGKPESWATAVVHMFLWELQDVLSRRIQERVLSGYGVGPAKRPDSKVWKDLVDIRITLDDGPETVGELFQKDVIDPINNAERGKDPVDLVRNPMTGARSALLFGPPGTSKTSVASALAKTLGWPLLTLDPSDFLSKGLDRIYRRANEIFDDLMDLSRAVIFFDEMDALVRSRDPDKESGGHAGPLDMTSQFLTTCMLPKLADLHKRARVIFLMATNHRKDFDRAIIRPGRFDLLVCVGPPSWKAKRKGLHLFLRDIEKTKGGRRPAKTEKQFNKEATEAKLILKRYVRDCDIKGLDLFTYGEFRQFISSLRPNGKSLAEGLQDVGGEEFTKKLSTLGRHAWFAPDKRGRNPAFAEYEEDKHESRRQT